MFLPAENLAESLIGDRSPWFPLAPSVNKRKTLTHEETSLNSQNKERHSGYGRYNPDATSRPTFYMAQELLQAIEAQARQEHASRSGFVSSVLGFLLLSPIGQQLRKSAQYNNRSLVQELEQALALFQEQLPLEEITQLAAASQRSPVQMLTYLVLRGLEAYKEKN